MEDVTPTSPASAAAAPRPAPVASATTITRIKKFSDAHAAPLRQNVLAHGYPAVLVATPPLVRRFTGTTDARWPLHQVMICLTAAARYFMIEYDDAAGPDFMRRVITYKETSFFDERGKPVMVAQTPDPHTGKARPAIPKQTIAAVAGPYEKRRFKDLCERRRKADYIALFEAADATLRGAGALGPQEPDGRASYAEKRRFHYDAHLAEQVFHGDACAASYLEDIGARSLARMRAVEWWLEKMVLIESWIYEYRQNDYMPPAAFRLQCMNAPVAEAAVGFLSDALGVVDASGVDGGFSETETRVLAQWAKLQADEDAFWHQEEQKLLAKEARAAAARAAGDGLIAEEDAADTAMSSSRAEATAEAEARKTKRRAVRSLKNVVAEIKQRRCGFE